MPAVRQQGCRNDDDVVRRARVEPTQNTQSNCSSCDRGLLFYVVVVVATAVAADAAAAAAVADMASGLL